MAYNALQTIREQNRKNMGQKLDRLSLRLQPRKSKEVLHGAR